MKPQSVSAGSIWPFKRPWVLYVSTLIFAVFYALIFIDEAFSLPVNNIDQLCVILLFLFFVIGFVFSWWNQLITGLLLVGYYMIIIYLLESKIINEMGPYGQFTFPVLVLGILYLVFWIYLRPRKVVNDR